jgi:hypothetical protein
LPRGPVQGELTPIHPTWSWPLGFKQLTFNGISGAVDSLGQIHEVCTSSHFLLLLLRALLPCTCLSFLSASLIPTISDLPSTVYGLQLVNIRYEKPRRLLYLPPGSNTELIWFTPIISHYNLFRSNLSLLGSFPSLASF